MKKYAILILLAFGAVSCGTFGLYSSDNSIVLASVGDAELRSSELENIYSGSLTKEDSAATRDAYVASWIRGQVKLQAAERVLAQANAADIDQMVDDYRNQLLTYKYENDYIETHIDTTVTKAQISEYYKGNKDNFRLVGPLVKARVVRLPAGLRQSKKLEDMFRSDKEATMADFINICQKNDYRFDDFKNQWVDFSIVLQHIPFPQKNFDEFLKKQKFYDVSDTEWKYLMRIDEYMLSGSISPAEREREAIVKIIKNLRRTELLRTLDDSLYKAATDLKLIKIETNEKN